MIFAKHKGKCLTGLLLLVVMFIVLTIPTFAEKADTTSGKTYYISSSEGDDNNNGLSEGSAWKSLGKAAEVKLQAGDSILLKSGDTWIGEQLIINEPTGTKESPALLGAYGEGEKPKLQMHEGEVPKYSATPVIQPINAEHFVIDGLDVGHTGVGIDLHYSMATNKENVHIQNCHFHDIYGFFQTDRASITRYPHATAIVVTSNIPIPGNSDPAIIGLYIDNCTSYDAGSLYTYGTRIGSSGHNVNNLYVTNCVMKNNGIYGIAVCAMTGGYMDNCKIVDCGSRYSPMGSMGVMISGEDFTIMNSEICYQQRLEDNPDGGGIDFEHLGYDIDVINCYIHDNSGVGVMMYSSGGDETHQNKRVRFIGNVFENNNQNVYKPGGAEILSLPMYSLVDGAIYNNRYMESDNLFTMSMDASVDIQSNVSYPQDKQGTMWPIYDFDDVRAYVIDGTPLPSLDEEPTEEETLYDWIYDNGNYFIGIVIGVLLLVILSLVKLLVVNKKKMSVSVLLLTLVMLFSFATGTTSYAADTGLLNKNGTADNGVYRLSKMCTSETNLWKYYWSNGTSDTEMVYDAETAMWNGAAPATTAMISGNKSWHPYTTGYTLATFTCPKSGTVRIGTETPIELTNASATQDGTIFIVMSDGELVGTPVQVNKEQPKLEYEVVEMDVYEGQEIGFYLHMHINNAGDSTRVQPFVEYTDYKEVAPVEKDTADGTAEEVVKVLRTDIAPMTIEEETFFVINPIQILIGGVPIALIGVGVSVVKMLIRKKKGEE